MWKRIRAHQGQGEHGNHSVKGGNDSNRNKTAARRWQCRVLSLYHLWPFRFCCLHLHCLSTRSLPPRTHVFGRVCRHCNCSPSLQACGGERSGRRHFRAAAATNGRVSLMRVPSLTHACVHTGSGREATRQLNPCCALVREKLTKACASRICWNGGEVFTSPLLLLLHPKTDLSAFASGTRMSFPLGSQRTTATTPTSFSQVCARTHFFCECACPFSSCTECSSPVLKWFIQLLPRRRPSISSLTHDFLLHCPMGDRR